MEEEGRFDRGDGIRLAWKRVRAAAGGTAPTTVFLPGYFSNMEGGKAAAAVEWCRDEGVGCLRLDYSGHGASDGAFTEGSIGEWATDAAAVVERFTEGKLVLIGSSMGGWIALLLALRLRERVAGLIGVAAAPDFTAELMWDAMMPPEREALERDGVLMLPNPYGDPVPVTMKLIREGRDHLLLGGPIPLTCPVRLLQGQRDPDVPWETALRIAERVVSADVRVHLIKDGDHRLSRPQDLALLREVWGELVRKGD